MLKITNVAKKIFGTQNDRELKSIAPIVLKINQLEPEIKKLSDAQLQGKTIEFKTRYQKGETLDQLLPEAFAVVREASIRTLGQRHYDVQLIGGITLHRGRIAEMRTGEGKTLTATLPVYLNALSGKGVHVVTVNDYLARRDSEHMGRVYGFLGLTTGIIVHGLSDAQRKANYGCDITYGTNNEYGFDYLRDNMKFRLEDYVQRELNFAIVDEVDSILIDEARTPLIISGPTDNNSDLYYQIDQQLKADGGLFPEIDYTIDEKSKSSNLTESGVDKMESRLKVTNLYDPTNIELLHHVNQALRANVIFKRDVDYVVRDGEVMIVDEFTGRLMPGRRWSDGLHQAIEAKEGVTIENENQTLATITFQNFFRMYNKLGGMTGTADTEATEFKQIYKLDVTIIPTNKKMIRIDHGDVIFKSQAAKFKSVAQEIKKLHEKGQPVLVGTVSVEKSEFLHQLLQREGVPHSVLNAKQHEREAFIVAQAGRKGAVTISTNMAGRGTDILLGGYPEMLAKGELEPLKKDATEEEKVAYETQLTEATARWKTLCAREREEVLAAGGLFILGTERHESRRIDNQLRGRAGRQGDPGASRFYLSFEDDLLRIFGSSELLKRTVAAMEDDVPIEHKLTTRAIENAQKKVEGHNYDIRKHLLEYDDVMNQQRKVVYAWRKEVLSQPDLKAMVYSMTEELNKNIAEEFFPNGRLRKDAQGLARLDIHELNQSASTQLGFSTHLTEKEISPFNHIGLKKLLDQTVRQHYNRKENEMTAEILRQIEKMVLLSTIDQLWKDHLLAMDHLREGIGLQGYGQKDPLIAYKKEGFKYFEMMMSQISVDVIKRLMSIQLAPQEAPEDALEQISEEFEEIEHNPSEPNAQIQYNLEADGSLSPVNSASPVKPLQRQQPAFLNQPRQPQPMTLSRGPVGSPLNQPQQPAFTKNAGGLSAVEEVGRNEPCPCGSGKKYKKCHGA